MMTANDKNGKTIVHTAVLVVIVGLLWYTVDLMVQKTAIINGFNEIDHNKEIFKIEEFLNNWDTDDDDRDKYIVSNEDILFFRENGYLKLKNVLSNETIDILSLYCNHIYNNPSQLFEFVKYYFNTSISQQPWIHLSLFDYNNNFIKIVSKLPFARIISKILKADNKTRSFGDTILLGDMHFHFTDNDTFAATNGKGSVHADTLIGPLQNGLTMENKNERHFGNFIVWLPIDDPNNNYNLSVLEKTHLMYKNNESQFCDTMVNYTSSTNNINWKYGIKTNTFDIKKGDAILLIDSLIHFGMQSQFSNVNNTRRLSFRYASNKAKCKDPIYNYLPFYHKSCYQNDMSVDKNPNDYGCDFRVLVNGSNHVFSHPSKQMCLPGVYQYVKYFWAKWTKTLIDPCSQMQVDY